MKTFGSESIRHSQIKAEILNSCRKLGFDTEVEARGIGWRADVLAANAGRQIAFEVQLSPQTLRRTLERQQKYASQEIDGCWLFERPIAKLKEERPDLPLFYILPSGPPFAISLIDGRKSLPLSDFVDAFLLGNIRFSQIARAKRDQDIVIQFFEMECWKCKATNHIYCVEGPYRSACNFGIEELTELWGDTKFVFRPEILKAVGDSSTSQHCTHIKLGAIKRRYSKTADHDYLSFGCHACDSIFGDWFVMEVTLDVRNGFSKTIPLRTSVTLDDEPTMAIPHWCYSGSGSFCEPLRQKSDEPEQS